MQNWPTDDTAALNAFYGNASADGFEDANIVVLSPLPYELRYQDDNSKFKIVKSIRCHKLVKDSLTLILDAVWHCYDKDIKKIQEARMDLYDGCYNYRTRRGSSTNKLSVHAYGAAVDFAAAYNQQGIEWKPGSGMIPMEVVNIFRGEGWVWGGVFSKPDCMHFQAAKI